MRYGYWCLLVVLVALAPGAIAQRQAVDFGGFSRMCLFVAVLIDGELVMAHEEAVLELLETLAAESGVQVRGAQECESLVFDAPSETLRIVLTLRMRRLSMGMHAYSLSLTGVRDYVGEHSSPGIHRITDSGVPVKAEQDAVLDEGFTQAFCTLVASWISALGASEVGVETSERREGLTPNGGAYSIAYYRDEGGNPATKDQAHSVEIIEYNADGEAIHSTIGYLNP